MGLIAEHFSDDKGLVWPKNIAPYQLEIILIDSKDAQSNEIAQSLMASKALAAAGVDMLVDDRSDTAGVKFNDVILTIIGTYLIKNKPNRKSKRDCAKHKRNNTYG